MTAGARAILDLIDAAPVFIDHPALTQEEIRKAGLAELDEVLGLVRVAEGELRRVVLAGASQRLGQLVAIDALHDGFVRAALEEAAAGCGLVRDDGLRAVKKAIGDGIKLGKKQPRDVSAMRSIVAAPTGATRSVVDSGPSVSPSLNQSRPRPAADRTSSSHDVGSVAAFPGDLPAPPAAAAPPLSPGAGESASSQMGASASEAATTGGAGGDKKPPKPVEDDETRNMRLAFFPLTDLGNAERFRERYRDKLLWCPAIGWLVWDGKRWSREGADDLVMIAEHDTVRAIQAEAKAVRASGFEEDGGSDFVVEFRKKEPVYYSDKVASWGRMSETANKLGALSKRGAPYFAVAIDRLDADKMKINVNNGTLVVRRRGDDDYVSFQPHEPADLITKLAPVDYDPDAVCPEYDKFLARVQPNAEMRAFLHQWLGLSLTGDISEQKLVFLYGKGSNGKSVLIEAVSYVAGDYGETVPIETFLDQGKSRGGGQATPDLAILPGVRMLRTSEPEKNSKLAEAMVKLVTGGEPILARHLNRDFFKFYPQFKLTISGNYRPQISGADEGIWRRMRLVPFSVFIPKEERDIHLGEKLRAEASGILNRLLDGLRTWCDKGLSEPEAVTTATAEYRSSSDPLGRFLAACVAESDGDRVQSSSLHELFEAWCKSSGEKPWSNRGLSLAMEERGYRRKQSNVMWWLDVKLIKSVHDFVDSQGHPVRFAGDDGVKEGGADVGDIEL